MKFNATQWPRIVVTAGFSPVVGGFILGTDHLGTGTLGGQELVDISDDVRSVSWQRGRDSDIDTANPGTCTIVLRNTSGDYDPTNLSGPYVDAGESLVDIGAPIVVRAERPAGLFYNRWTGEVADIQIDAGLNPTVTLTCADGLETLGRAQLATEPPVFDGDTTGARIGHLADRADWPATARAIDTGRITLGPTVLGATALELMHRTEQAEFGLLFVDAGGVLVFFERHRATNASRSVTVQAALTDTRGADELGMMELELALSRARVYNDVHITRDPSPLNPDEEPDEQVATDTASVDRYGLLNFPAQVGQLLRSDTDALGLAQGLVGLYATPQVRIREVRINALRPDPTTGDGLWDVILPLTLLDRISVRRDYGPVTIGPTELLIQSISEEISVSPARWELRLTTSEPPAAVDYFVLGDGRLGTDMLGW